MRKRSVFLLFMLLACTSVLNAATYTVHLLSVKPENLYSINEAGDVGGQFANSAARQVAAWMPFGASQATIIGTYGCWRNGFNDYSCGSRALGINNAQRVVGFTSVDGSYAYNVLAFSWENGTTTILPVSYEYSLATDVNNTGAITGYGRLNTGNYGTDYNNHAFVYFSNSNWQELLGQDRNWNSQTYSINADNTVAGCTYLDPKSRIPAYWQDSTGQGIYEFIQLPFTQNGGCVSGINDNGMMVGEADFPISSGDQSNRGRRSMIWLPSGQTIEFGETKYNYSMATAVNNAGQVVGWEWADVKVCKPLYGCSMTKLDAGYVYENGVKIHLSDLLASGENYHVLRAVDIAENGKILATVMLPNNTSTGAVLIPQ